MTEKQTTDTMQIELTEGQFERLHAMILLGLNETAPWDPLWGEAYDAFCESADVPLRIGDQPPVVQKVWRDILLDDFDQ